MLGSAALNVAFGFPTALYFLIFVWACNGYCQSLGWTPCVRVMANWVPARRRGKAIGIVGTGYQVTAALTFVVSGLAAEHLGWRGAFYLPAGLLTAAAIHMLFFLRETPQQHAAAGAAVLDAPPAATRTTDGLRHNLVATLTNPALWVLAIGLGLLNACRYGFLDWGLSHVKEVQGTGVAMAAFKYAVLPLGGIAGSFISGWATDRFFDSRRAPVICILLVSLGVLTLLYDQVVRSSVIGTVLLLAVIGFTVYGPQVLLVGTAPADLARRGTAAAAAGFVNFMGYMGAFCGDFVTGHVKDTYGWSVAVKVMAAGGRTAPLVCNSMNAASTSSAS